MILTYICPLYTANPAVQATRGLINVTSGQYVSIEFYASGLPYITANNVSWTFNGLPLSGGNFTFNERILTILSVNSSHAGNYTFTVNNTVHATTVLIVTGNHN